MKNKNEDRKQILLRLLSKSNQMMDDIVSLTMQIHVTPGLINLNERFLLAQDKLLIPKTRLPR